MSMSMAEPDDAEGPDAPETGGDGAGAPIIIGFAKDGWRDGYHWLLSMPIGAFLGLAIAAYLALNAVFAVGYVLTGGVTGARLGSFPDAFFFSVETMSTVGYGELAPASTAAHVLVTVECFVGLFNLAIVTGLLFARFSKPTARVMFSRNAVVTTYEGQPTLMFRAANKRRNRIVEAEVTLSMLRDSVTAEGVAMRGFEPMTTIRARTPVFYMTWQIMHRIDELSPLYSETRTSLAARRAELVVVLRGLDETFSQTIHARTSYPSNRVVWDRRLADMFSIDGQGRTVIDYTLFHDLA
jgi:inward rectifier potassium channel